MGTYTHHALMLRIYLYSLGLRSKKRYMIHSFKLNTIIIFRILLYAEFTCTMKYLK